MKRTIFLCVWTAFGLFQASAQEERRQAAITGRGGSPKCTIEVEVDVVADVEIRGTMARLHTISGSPAVWRRFECNEPMPLNPANFRFRGIDGRGRQTLIGDPRSSGAAVVRIEDPKAGREGYTFDLEWAGSAGPEFAPPPPPVMPPFRGDDRDGRFSSSDAIHQCGEAAEGQLRSSGYAETRVTNATLDDQPGHNDWISGSVSGRRGPYVENFSFACPVDLGARRVGPVNVRPANDGYYGGAAGRDRFSREEAVRACGEAVRERLRHDGYGDFRIGRIDLDDRPGNHDWVMGELAARRGGFSDNFEFSCSVDFDGGRVRSINVNRR